MQHSCPGLARLRQPDASRTVIPCRPRHFTATLLLDHAWDLDVAAVAITIVVRFPTIGRVRPLWGRKPDAPPSIEIDGGKITLRYVPEPISPDALMPARLPPGQWHSGIPLPCHVAHVDIECGGTLPGIEGAKAYAAAVHFVATAACAVAPACAVFWRMGGVLSTPADFAQGAESILRRRVPLDSWISFGTVPSTAGGLSDATGILTFGLCPFIGGELELVTQPGSPIFAWNSLSQITNTVLHEALLLKESEAGEQGRYPLTVRVRDCRPLRELSPRLVVADARVMVPGQPGPGCRSAG